MNFPTTLLPLADLMLKGTLVLALALLAAQLGRGASAANRYAVWLAAFALLLLLPLTLLLTPRWLWSPAVPVPPRGTPVLSSAPFVPVPPLPQPATTTPAAPASAGGAPVSVVSIPGDGWLLGWLAGVALLLARLGVGAGQLAWWRRRSAPLTDDRAQALVRRIAADLRLTRVVELRTALGCRVPMTWGLLRPVVLLPADVATWPELRLDLVLRHELGHVARHDCAARLLAQCAAALYWPNPLVWLALRAMRLAQEQACDDLVLAAGTPAETYALELVAATRLLHRSQPPVPVVAMAEPSTLGRRIENIIAGQRDRRTLGRKTATWATMLTGVVLVGLASAQVRNSGAGPTPAGTGPADPFELTPSPMTVQAAPVQIAIEASFIKIGQGEFDLNSLGPAGTTSPPAGSTRASTTDNRWIGRVDVPALLHSLAQKPGYELMGAPSLALLSGNMANMSAQQELRYPQSYSATGEPQDFTTRNLGIQMNATVTVATDGQTLKLHLNARSTELDGYIKYGTADRIQPVFSTREIETEVSMQDGTTLVLQGMSMADVPNHGEIPTAANFDKYIAGNSDPAKKRMQLVIITARIVKTTVVAKP